MIPNYDEFIFLKNDYRVLQFHSLTKLSFGSLPYIVTATELVAKIVERKENVFENSNISVYECIYSENSGLFMIFPVD